MQPLVGHTLVIFQKMHDSLSPLVPDTLRDALAEELASYHNDIEVNVAGLESTMAHHAHALWPYQRAFYEMRCTHEEDFGCKLLLQRVPRHVRSACEAFFDEGGTFHDVYCGKAMHLFPIDDRPRIAELLIELKNEIKKHVVQLIHTHQKSAYETRVQELQKIVDVMRGHLDTLHELADCEEDYPELADEIRAHVQAVEHGLTYLGPHIQCDAVARAPEHFAGRREERKMRI